MSPSQPEDSTYKYFKGDVAKVYAWNRALTPEEVNDIHLNPPTVGKVLDLDITDPITKFENFGAEIKEEEISIPNSVIPHRVEGKMRCLPHKDEGIVNGKFVKGDTTAANERRYVLGMQQGKLSYKEDGIKQVEYNLVKEHIFTPWAKMLDVEL